MIISWIKRKLECHRVGHDWGFECPSLGGDWIRCLNCKMLEEHIPGVHEVKGYTNG